MIRQMININLTHERALEVLEDKGMEAVMDELNLEVFAACVNGLQDKEWNNNKNEYLDAGCSVEYVRRCDVDFGECNCAKTPVQIAKKMQLSLF